MVAPIKDEDHVDELAARPSSDGLSALQLMGHATSALAQLHAALRASVVHDDATVDARLLDDGGGSPANASPASSVEAGLDALQLECEAFAATVDGVHGDQWTRTLSVKGSDRTVRAIDLPRAAAKTGAEALRATEQAMVEARRAH